MKAGYYFCIQTFSLIILLLALDSFGRWDFYEIELPIEAINQKLFEDVLKENSEQH